jgi:hypothetical protein
MESMDGTFGATSQGNTRLVAHGIQEDASDMRIHIAFGDRYAFVFPTHSAQKAISSDGKQYPAFRASQDGTNLITGTGYRVPWTDIEGCKRFWIPREVLDAVSPRITDSTSEKGRKAESVAWELIRLGTIAVSVSCRPVTDTDDQIKGTDLRISGPAIQVKCDWWAGSRGLAIQTHECNPFKKH